jgi:hypothetical protein
MPRRGEFVGVREWVGRDVSSESEERGAGAVVAIVVVCGGGGYRGLCDRGEGHAAAVFVTLEGVCVLGISTRASLLKCI